MNKRVIHIKKGLDIPIPGAPAQVISDAPPPSKVALIGTDYVGMKPHFEVEVGDRVKLGQLLFTDRKQPSIRYTSPGAGRIVSINRGKKRVLLSVVIALDSDDEITFKAYHENNLASLTRKQVIEQLLESGLWTALRARPFGKVANPNVVPNSIFITAMDTSPLAPSIEKTIEGVKKHFVNGLNIISKLTDGKIFLCKKPKENIPFSHLASLSIVEFTGPHPSGNVGTHIHFLDPVHRNKQAWYICAQNLVAVGALFTTGRILVDRIVSLAGPSATNPRLLKTRIGVSTEDITKSELLPGDHRIISGSVLSGHTAYGPTAFLGRYDQQISVIPEERERHFLGWMLPGTDRYSCKNIVLSRLLPGTKFKFTTSLRGEARAIVPIGNYEKIMPLDIMATQLLKALAVDDVEEAERLGCLELDEEDLALCTFVCPSKINHGEELRRNLTQIEKEG